VLSLQKGFGSEQIESLECGAKIHQFENIDAEEGAFMDTAAILGHLDLFITSDSAIAHLAGALGINTWLILPYAPDWRWLLDRETTNWYPTVRLFRQTRFRDWSEIFARITNELEEFVSAGTPEHAGV